MATLATESSPGNPLPGQPAPPRMGAQAERRFYIGMALFSIAVVVAGFSHSFFLRAWVHFPYPKPVLSPFIILHGLVFFAWMLIFLAQTWLVAVDRRDLHRRLGMAGFAVGLAILPLAYLVAVGQAARGSNPPIATPLDWTVVPISGIPAMAGALWLGLRMRKRDLQAHKRFMLAFTLMMLEPATGRLPLGPPSLEMNAVAGVIALLPFFALFVWDWRSLGRLHWASLTGAGLAAGAALFRQWFLFHPGLWTPVAVHLPGVGA